MTANEFFEAISKELENRDIPSDFANSKLNQIKARVSQLDNKDADKFFSEDNLQGVVKKICDAYDSEFNSNNTMTITKTCDEVEEGEGDKKGSSAVTEDTPKGSDKNSGQSDGKKKITVVTPTGIPQTGNEDNFFLKLWNKVNGSANPDKRDSRIMLISLLIIFAPVIILICAAALVGFAGAFVSLAAAIVAIIAVIFVVVMGGSVLSVASLLFGVLKLLSDTKYIGVHEVGLGLIFVGATLFIGISLYNVAVRLIPWLYRLLGKLFVFICKLFGKTVAAVSKGCDKL